MSERSIGWCVTPSNAPAPGGSDKLGSKKVGVVAAPVASNPKGSMVSLSTRSFPDCARTTASGGWRQAAGVGQCRLGGGAGAEGEGGGGEGGGASAEGEGRRWERVAVASRMEENIRVEASQGLSRVGGQTDDKWGSSLCF